MDTESTSLDAFDAVVVGGGAAGISAALVLGRSCRRVLLADTGPVRNAPASAAHNVFTRDGTPPADLLRIGRAQLAPYDVTVRNDRVTEVERTGGGFSIRFAGGVLVRSRKVLLAIGVRDVLPAIPGLRELWGSSVFHCPYCHGWEVAGRPLALYGRGETALHLTQMLLGWSDDLVLFTDGPAELTTEQRAQVVWHGVVVREERVERLVGAHGHLEAVVLEGGEVVPRAGMFLSSSQELRSDLPYQLGCPLTSDGRIEADPYGRTGVPGVYVAGDSGPGVQQVSVAAASGTTAGMFLNNDLLAEEFEGHGAMGSTTRAVIER